MTRFDDVHSDGVGSGIITERHQQVTSSPLRKHTHTHKQTKSRMTHSFFSDVCHEFLGSLGFTSDSCGVICSLCSASAAFNS